jgi:hypothetical protein
MMGRDEKMSIGVEKMIFERDGAGWRRTEEPRRTSDTRLDDATRFEETTNGREKYREEGETERTL